MNIFDIIFPTISIYSSSIDSYVDEHIYKALPDKLKPLTQHQHAILSQLYVAFPYSGIIQSMMERIKGGYEWDILRELAHAAFDAFFLSKFFIPSPEYIIPVPPDPVRRTIRGFDHTRLISKCISRSFREIDWNAPMLTCLKKNHHTPSQGLSTKKVREKALRGVFTLSTSSEHIGKLASAETVWIVDDIATTGSTLVESATVLKKAFPHLTIIGFAVAGN